jgi:Trp operon repressor
MKKTLFKYISLIFFLFFSLSNSYAKVNVVYGGFSYGSIIQDNSYTKFLHDRNSGQSFVDKVLLSTTKKLNNNTFKISYNTLSDYLSEDDQNVMVLALDNELIEHITIPGDNLTRTDIILNFQIIFFNAKNNFLTASIPLEVSKIINSSKKLNKEQIIQELKKLYENDVMKYFLQVVQNFNLKTKYKNRIGVTKVILEKNAENYIIKNSKNNDIFKKNRFANSLGSFLSYNNNIAIVPYNEDRTSSSIMLTFENTQREIKLPNPDYHIHLTIRGFKNVLFKESNIDEQWIYGSYINIKFLQPDLDKIYFEEKFKNGLNVEFSKRSTKNKGLFEWIFYVDSLKILFDNFSKQTIEIDKKWLKSSNNNKKVKKLFKVLDKIYESCK